MDASDFGGGDDGELRLLKGEEGFNVGLASEIELAMGAKDEVCEP